MTDDIEARAREIAQVIRAVKLRVDVCPASPVLSTEEASAFIAAALRAERERALEEAARLLYAKSTLAYVEYNSAGHVYKAAGDAIRALKGGTP